MSSIRAVSARLDSWASYTLDKIFDDRAGWEVQNLIWNAAVIARAAAWRRESRGTHYRLDYAEADPDMRVHFTWRRGRDEPGAVGVSGAPNADRGGQSPQMPSSTPVE